MRATQESRLRTCAIHSLLKSYQGIQEKSIIWVERLFNCWIDSLHENYN